MDNQASVKKGTTLIEDEKVASGGVKLGVYIYYARFRQLHTFRLKQFELHVNHSMLFISHEIANNISILHNEFEQCDTFLGMWPSILLFFNLYIHNVF